MAFLTAGLLPTSRRSRVGGSYVGDLLPGFLVIAVGMGFSFVPISIAALAGVQPAEAGLASGLINTSQQIGGALGIAALSAIATSTTERHDRDGRAPRDRADRRLPGRLHRAAPPSASSAILVALFVVRGRDIATTAPAVEAAPVEAAEVVLEAA